MLQNGEDVLKQFCRLKHQSVYLIVERKGLW